MGKRALIAAINWNGKEFITEMVNSLLPQMQETDTSLLIFDNGSEDGSADLLEEKYRSTGMVTVFRNGRNIGFGKAANKILADAECSTVVLVNTDTVLKPGCLKNLLTALESRPRVAFAGPRLLWPDGSLQSSRRDFPFPGKLILEHIPLLKNRTARFSAHDKGCYTDWLVGAMMAIRVKAFLEIGGFADEFFFFHEETDLQYRLAENGWKVWFEPSAEVLHIEGGSSKQKYGSRVYLRNIPGKLLFLKKQGSFLDVFLFRILMTILQIHRLFFGWIFSKFAGTDIRYTSGYCCEAIQLLWHRNRKSS
ncbi:MAG: glycosyltransferase family 2 protein [Candidatus Fermentibacteria bacterium]|nr:glycosyltransferase family 2 protein [Candidatus Fermentibacteria bacterium]